MTPEKQLAYAGMCIAGFLLPDGRKTVGSQKNTGVGSHRERGTLCDYERKVKLYLNLSEMDF
ncbi:MAG: hypothetical protein K2I53_03815 [Lachnospiraceae bacterium]|nr:hypothetical protein [Lachnospiraceae bacterium]